MKEAILLVGICGLVVLSVGWYLLPAPAYDFFRKSAVSVQPHPGEGENSQPAEPEPEQEPRRSHSKHVASKPPVLHAGLEGNAERFVPVPAPAPPAFPAPADVRPGTERSRIIEKFGTPALAASTADRGHLFETFVYRRERLQTVIRMQDGTVAAVHLR